ncbi:radical SAM protein [Pseudonocardia sp. MH-G8]|nr:radical SAM protein [Pseudonocardia sp. MH-G8]
MNPALTDVIEYRKSGLSVNHVVGCPLDCGYCVRHLFDNFGLKTPRALMSDQEAFYLLVNHPSFLRDVTPLQIFNRATDPMLASVKPHTFAMLELLDNAGLRNHVLVITRWRVDADDCDRLNSFANIRLTLLVTHSGITDPRIEPVDSGIASNSLRTAYEQAERFRAVFYWRPLVPGLNDTDRHLAEAMELTRFAHATVYTGLFYRDQIRAYYQAHGLPEPYGDTARRKILPGGLEQRVLAAAASRTGGSPLFRKTSCGVAYAHGMADYNGHYGIRELCDICPSAQVDRCSRAWARPDPAPVAAAVAGLGGELVAVTERAVMVKGLDEQRRYLLQHTHGYQVHDVAKPHHRNRHGRADLGWTTTESETSPC